MGCCLSNPRYDGSGRFRSVAPEPLLVETHLGADEDANEKPYGRTQYSFDDAPEVILPKAGHSSKQLDLAKQITKRYSEIVEQRKAIKEALTASARLLGLSAESTELTSSFQTLKESTAKKSKLILDREQGGPSKITAAADEKAKGWHWDEALIHFNSALAGSFILLNLKEDADTFIQSKLSEMRKLSLTQAQTRESQDLYGLLQDIPRYLDNFAAEVKRFLHDVNVANLYLEVTPQWV